MFADQLNALCSRPDRPVTNVALARSLTARGCPISTAYLSQLRTGIRTRPTSRIVEALAAHFDVPVDYFYPSTVSNGDKPDIADPVIVDTLRDPSLRRLLACSHELSTTSTDLLTEVASHLRASENLPPRCADTPIN